MLTQMSLNIRVGSVPKVLFLMAQIVFGHDLKRSVRFRFAISFVAGGVLASFTRVAWSSQRVCEPH